VKISSFLIIALLSCSVKAQLTAYEVGDLAPNFTGIEPDGTEHTLYNYTSAGKYVLIDFFAYWCGPCMSTAPKVQLFYEKYGCNMGNVVVLGNECDVGGSNADLLSFYVNADMDSSTAYPSWSGMEGNGADVCNIYSPYAYPTVVLIGPDNQFINIDIWPIAGVEDIEAAFPAGVLSELDCSEATGLSGVYKNWSEVILYPNPATEKTVLSFEAPKGGTLQLEFVNALGQTVKELSLYGMQAGRNQLPIDFGDLAAGIYHIKGSMQAVQVFQTVLQIVGN
jgi:thiol-disulfide isomerase/thioredoxin